MTRLFAIGLLLLSLSACATSPASGEKSVSDLDVMVMGVEALAQPREPSGDVKRVEDAATAGQVFNLALDLEEVDWLHEEDKKRIVWFVQRATERIKTARNPCSWWERVRRVPRCAVAAGR